jgi:hypothetical protein
MKTKYIVFLLWLFLAIFNSFGLGMQIYKNHINKTLGILTDFTPTIIYLIFIILCCINLFLKFKEGLK